MIFVGISDLLRSCFLRFSFACLTEMCSFGYVWQGFDVVILYEEFLSLALRKQGKNPAKEVAYKAV